MKKDLQTFVYALRIDAEVQVIEMVCYHSPLIGFSMIVHVCFAVQREWHGVEICRVQTVRAVSSVCKVLCQSHFVFVWVSRLHYQNSDKLIAAGAI